jgi:chaperonin GroES
MATATKTKSSKKSSAGKKLKPLGDRVVVEREEAEDVTAGGIVLPDAAKDKPSRGTVIAVGEGRMLDDGTRHPVQVSKGDRVIFTSYAPQEIEVDGNTVLLLRESDILAVIEG